MTLISNEFRTVSLSDGPVAAAADEARGSDRDPMDLLIEFEEKGERAAQAITSSQSRQAFVDRYVRDSIANL